MPLQYEKFRPAAQQGGIHNNRIFLFFQVSTLRGLYQNQVRQHKWQKESNLSIGSQTPCLGESARANRLCLPLWNGSPDTTFCIRADDKTTTDVAGAMRWLHRLFGSKFSQVFRSITTDNGGLSPKENPLLPTPMNRYWPLLTRSMLCPERGLGTIPQRSCLKPSLTKSTVALSDLLCFAWCSTCYCNFSTNYFIYHAEGSGGLTKLIKLPYEAHTKNHTKPKSANLPFPFERDGRWALL